MFLHRLRIVEKNGANRADRSFKHMSGEKILTGNALVAV